MLHSLGMAQRMTHSAEGTMSFVNQCMYITLIAQPLVTFSAMYDTALGFERTVNNCFYFINCLAVSH